MSMNKHNTRGTLYVSHVPIMLLGFVVTTLLMADVLVGAKLYQATVERNAQTEGGANMGPAPTSMEVLMLGDVGLQDEIVQSARQADGTYKFDFAFDRISDELNACDLRIINQETSLAPADPDYVGAQGQEVAWAPTDAVAALAAKVDACGFSAVMDATDSMYLFERNGLKVGVLTYASLASDEGVADQPLETEQPPDATATPLPYEQTIREDVAKVMDTGAELLVVCPRWGNGYETQPTDEQRAYAGLFCELGADVVFGCHPHMLQPVELLHNTEGHRTVCFYSVGTFLTATDAPTESFIGGIARVTLTRDKDGTCGVAAANLVPTVTCRTVGPNMGAYQLKDWTYELADESSVPFLTPDYAHAFCAQLLGHGFDDASGRYVVDLS
jgi:poly-gamma-glutamate synthesis protein (capsule biosynthesis protein)